MDVCPPVKNIPLLDSEGKHNAVKYYSDELATNGAKEALENSVFTNTQKKNTQTEDPALSQKVHCMISGDSVDYDSWRSLILEIEAASPEDIDTISLAYDSLLSRFPLCHWHLDKYASHKAKLCGAEEALKIFERGVGNAMFSVGFWVDYFTFGTSCFEDPEDVRRLFERAVSFVGKDYYCHVLWDKYLNYEFNQEGWRFLAMGYIQALKFPSKKLQFYYDNFKKFISNLEGEIGYKKNNRMEVDQTSASCSATKMSRDEISLIIKDLLDSSELLLKSKSLDRYRAIGEEFYQEACQMDKKIKCFENNIRRRYFSATPVDDDQLNNWHLYLDFIEKLDDLDWAVKLYERCLIPCANYPEFWMRYVDFLESKGGRELAISALDRATQVFLKNVPEIHLFSARLKEHIGDANGARAALRILNTKTNSRFIENIAALTNLERRRGNFEAASSMYKKALKTATKQRRLHLIPSLVAQFAQFTFLTTGNATAARDILLDGIKQVPHCRFLIVELIKFAMVHDGASHLNIIEEIVANSISPAKDDYQGLNVKDREDISSLFLEFVNLCGTIHDVRKAWNRHIKLFPQFLRIRTTRKQSTLSSNLLGGAADPKGNQDRPSENHSTDLLLNEVFEDPVNNEIDPNQVSGKQSPPKDAASQNEYEQSRKSREDKLGRISFSAELTDKSKENNSNEIESYEDPPHPSTDDKPEQMNVCAEITKQSNGNLAPDSTTQDVPKSSAESVEASSTGEKANELEIRTVNCQQRIPADTKESSSIGDDSIEINVQKRPPTVLASSPFQQPSADGEFNSERSRDPADTSGTKSQTNVDNSQHTPAKRKYSEAQLDDKAAEQNQHVSTAVASIADVGLMPAPSHPVSQPTQDTSQISSQNQQPWQQQPQNPDMNQMLQYYYYQQQYLQQQYQQQQLQMQNPYLQMQQSYMNQQFYQLQPQQPNQQPVNQHQQLQSPPYQLQQQTPFLQSQQQMQQQITPFPQPQQQMQQQSTPFPQQQQQMQQQITPFPQPQQQIQQQISPFPQPQQQITPSQQSQQQYLQNQQAVGHMQLQQGKEPPANFQQTPEKQQHQTQDLAYQAQQLAYQQHALQTQQQQQLLLQQYQQYQSYQHMQQQNQSLGGPIQTEEHVHQHSVQNPRDEQFQQHHQAISTKTPQNISQTQQSSEIPQPDYNGEAKASESSHRRDQSPEELE